MSKGIFLTNNSGTGIGRFLQGSPQAQTSDDNDDDEFLAFIGNTFLGTTAELITPVTLTEDSVFWWRGTRPNPITLGNINYNGHTLIFGTGNNYAVLLNDVFLSGTNPVTNTITLTENSTIRAIGNITETIQLTGTINYNGFSLTIIQ